MSDKNLYKSSGVDIAKGDEMVAWLKDHETPGKTKYGQVEKGIGGFAGLFRPEFSTFKDPLLVSGTDGVGTKLLLALEQNQLEGIGEDLVAMCVNDLYCIGATPLFFLDYYATGFLDDKQFKTILSSIRSGLSKCSTALLGGETAEMPGLYEKNHFDLCGFVVGVVDKDRQLGGHRVQIGDRLVALKSSGCHSNGYSLIRKLLNDNKISDEQLLKQLMAPTKIYGCLPEIIESIGVERFHALANITGGGISGNLCRALPDNLNATVDGNSIQTQIWLKEFLRQCKVSPDQVEPVLNLGVGMVAVVQPNAVDELVCSLTKNDVQSYEIGEITANGAGKVVYSNPIGG